MVRSRWHFFHPFVLLLKCNTLVVLCYVKVTFAFWLLVPCNPCSRPSGVVGMYLQGAFVRRCWVAVFSRWFGFAFRVLLASWLELRCVTWHCIFWVIFEKRNGSSCPSHVWWKFHWSRLFFTESFSTVNSRSLLVRSIQFSGFLWQMRFFTFSTAWNAPDSQAFHERVFERAAIQAGAGGTNGFEFCCCFFCLYWNCGF